MNAPGGPPGSRVISFHGKEYGVDQNNLLLRPEDWDENFAEGIAPMAGLAHGLTEKHWEVILFIRRYWSETGTCPTVYQTCRILGLHLAGFHFLFPAGYQRGACKLAGISFKSGLHGDGRESPGGGIRSYRIDVYGFLLDPDEWDDRFAIMKAAEMKLPGGLTPEHWEILRTLRQEYYRNWHLPTCHEACQATGIDMEDFERLFPDGYVRGAVKMAGLRIPEGDP